MLSRLSGRFPGRFRGPFSGLNEIRASLGDEHSIKETASWRTHGFSEEAVKRKRPDSTRVKLGKSAMKFLQDAHRPEVLSEFPELTKMGTMKGKYGVRFQDKFAVVQLGSHQFKVTSDDVIYTEKLKDVDVMDKLKLGRVLLIGSKETTAIGRPFIPGASVWACVEEQCQDAKVIIFKKNRRKNYRKNQGHRQELTGLRILDICSPKPKQEVATNQDIEVERNLAIGAAVLPQDSSSSLASVAG